MIMDMGFVDVSADDKGVFALGEPLGKLHSQVGLHSGAANIQAGSGIAQYTVNLRSVNGEFGANIASAIGANYNTAVAAVNANGIGAGVTSMEGAMAVMDMAQSAQEHLDRIRADLGSVQQQMQSTVNNITVTQVNVKSAESGIREVDFLSFAKILKELF